MPDKIHKHFLNKKKLAILFMFITVTGGYLAIALTSKTMVAILLLPIFLTPLVTILFVKCFIHKLPSLEETHRSPSASGQFMKWIGYSIYLFLFVILALVFSSWLLKHF